MKVRLLLFSESSSVIECARIFFWSILSHGFRLLVLNDMSPSTISKFLKLRLLCV